MSAPADFTEDEYRALLALVAAGWRSVPFSAAAEPGRLCLWRHDVDFSPQRALALARLEAEAGVTATYFVLLHSEFYNPLERGVAAALREVLRLGHHLGLHFDPAAAHADQRVVSGEALQRAAARERALLEDFFETEVGALSYHNPDTLPQGPDVADQVAGMVNAYGRTLRERFAYVSDSNGYWRFQRLREVLEAGAAERLQVLTHPEWWTPEPLAPRARVSRCIDGRARAQHEAYDQFLARHGRLNVR